jgi:anti-sigma regulatory factor (Ser/Thr protein kinase)
LRPYPPTDHLDLTVVIGGFEATSLRSPFDHADGGVPRVQHTSGSEGGSDCEMAAKFRVEVQRVDDAVRQVRDRVRSIAGPDPPAEVVDDVLLACSELVTNAIVHTTGSVVAAASFDSDGVWRIEIDDESSEPPVLRDPQERTRIGGRGLHIVRSVATHWGVEPLPGGKRCWFEIRPDA